MKRRRLTSLRSFRLGIALSDLLSRPGEAIRFLAPAFAATANPFSQAGALARCCQIDLPAPRALRAISLANSSCV